LLCLRVGPLINFNSAVPRDPIKLEYFHAILVSLSRGNIQFYWIPGHCRGDPLLCPRDTLYPLKLALTSPTCGGRSVGIVPLRVKATELEFSHVVYVTLDGVLDWISDLLIILKQLVWGLSLISTLYKSSEHTWSLFQAAFTSLVFAW
jgi:hypothetical protein